MKIILASHTFIGGTFVVGSHHLADSFAKMGHEVLHISTPITPFHLLKIKDKEIRQRFQLAFSTKMQQGTKNIYNIVPIGIIPSNIMVTKKKIHLMNLKHILRKTNFLKADLLLIDEPTLYPICNMVSCKKIIYRPTDIYSYMRNNNQIDVLERWILKRSGSFIATSSPVYQHIKKVNSAIPGSVIVNGVDFDHFNKEMIMPKIFNNIKGKKIVYAGSLDNRIDLEAFIFLAKKFPNISIIIIGPINTVQEGRMKKYKNIICLGPINYKILPSYLQSCDIGLLPLSNDPSNNGRSPMKLYEYAAAGLTPICRSTEELSRRNNQENNFIFLYNDYKQLGIYVNKVICYSRSEIESKKDSLYKIAKLKSWYGISKLILSNS